MQLNATAVFPLNEANVDVLKKMQVRFIDQRPEGAKYLAFLEDGDACFLESIDRSPMKIVIPQMHMLAYYENVLVEFED